MLRFVKIEILLLTEINLIEIHLGGAGRKIVLQIMKERTRFSMCVLLTLFVYLQPFKGYST